MKKSILLSVALLLGCTIVSAQNWAPAGDRIRTSWADEADPAAVLPEYPRPQMVRSEWQNLNGLWSYAITSADAEYKEPDGQILVPFAVESSLSGVGRSVKPGDALWYERTFTVPAKWRGRNVRLNFGAVDWKSEIWVNGTKVGEHTGGYTPFSLDITSALKKSGKQTLRIKVQDASDKSFQPRGKQWMNPRGIWYTPVTGIWQTVWMEPVQTAHVESYLAEADVDANTIRISTKAEGLKEGDKVHTYLYDGDKEIGTATGPDVIFEVAHAKYWTPDSPFLYTIRVEIKRGKKVIDRVEGYTAMRKISVKMDKSPNRYRRLALNNEILFQFGPLDQGWWPDGLYTAPTDEALRYDIEQTKKFGFNMIRKHIKVEPARWYYWCDKLGMIVWQDMPSISDSSHDGNGWSSDSLLGGTDAAIPQEWKDNYYKEWSEIIEALKPFKCICVWVPFNEAWGQFDTPEVIAFTKAQDPTRLVNPASGGNYDLQHWGDILDVHHYPCPAMNVFERKYCCVLGEYGGIGFPVQGHLWKKDGSWGYGQVKSSGEEVLEQYSEFAEMLKLFKKTGCAAAVYTQTTDVEVEVNGLMTYDRKVTKMDTEKLSEVNKGVIAD